MEEETAARRESEKSFPFRKHGNEEASPTPRDISGFSGLTIASSCATTPLMDVLFSDKQGLHFTVAPFAVGAGLFGMHAALFLFSETTEPYRNKEGIQ